MAATNCYSRLALLLFVCTGILPLHAQDFVRLTSEIGLNHHYQHTAHIGGGAVIIDVNNDGFMDLYLPGGNGTDKILINQNGEFFTDITTSTGLGMITNRYTLGGVAGDFNNDGWEDLLITTWRFVTTWGGPNFDVSNVLMINNGDNTFTNMTGISGLMDAGFSASATLVDVNQDGFLDIYVANYVEQTNLLFDPETNQVNGFAHECQDNFLFINEAGLNFVNQAAQYGVNDNGCGLAATASDFDFDGYPDLMVINDFGQWVVPNKLYRNEGNGFADISQASGADVGIYGMGVAIGDYDEDGDLDYYITNLGRNVLLRQDSVGVFTDITTEAGVENAQIGNFNTTGWGTFFFDYDNDSHLDLFVSNGQIPAAPFIATAMYDHNKLYRNNQDGTFTDIAPEHLLNDSSMSRGAVVFDFNNDGKLDILVVSFSGGAGHVPTQTALFLNQSDNDYHYIMFKLVGTTVNKSAIGARAELFAGGRRLIREVDAGSGFASHNDKRLHFGLGEMDQVDSVLVFWPGVAKPQVVYQPEVDQIHTIVQEDIVTSTSHLDDDLNFRIFPNPTNGRLTLHWPNESGEVHLSLLNTSGLVITSEQRFFGANEQVDLSHWLNRCPPGLYIVRADSPTGTHWARLSVIR
ncbi:MAG: T9SS C-terminal target domain-containing protein [Cryomorphaceae bacterium]|nr:MAG: T9SS C-terminal target domain-containing protein [Cryomorphaceae bacterium]